jgi:hypothetical protein
MNGRQAGRRPFDDVPSVAQLVGVWAGAVTQLWDMAAGLWSAAAEQGFAEQRDVELWGTGVVYPIPANALDVRCVSLINDAGESVPVSDVTVEPSPIGPGAGTVELDVRLQRPVQHTSPVYTLTLAGFHGDTEEPDTRRDFRRGFGVQRG